MALPQAANIKRDWNFSALTGLNHNDPIATVTDASGQGGHLAQGTSAARATFKTNVSPSGLAAGYFDGVDDTYDAGNLSAVFPAAATVIAVFKPDSDNEYSVYRSESLSPGSYWRYQGDGNGYFGVFRGTRLEAHPAGMPTTGNHIVGVRSSSADYRVMLDRVLQTVQAASYLAGTSHMISPLERAFKGWVYRIIVWNVALTDSELQAAHDELNSIYFTTPPGAPSNLTAPTVSHSQVIVTWTDNSTDETNFRVERKTGSGGTYAEIGTAPSNGFSYTDNTVSPSTTYYYRVRAYRLSDAVYSAYSNEVSVNTSAAPPLAVSPSASTYRAAVPLPTPLVLFTATQSVRFTTTHGTLLTSMSPRTVYNGLDYRQTVYLEPNNETRQVTVTATNASAQSAGATIQVYETLTPPPDFGMDVESVVPAEKSYAPDQKTFTVRYNGDDVQKWNLVWTGRRLSERSSVKAAHARLRLHTPFYLDDKVLGELTLVVFDSNLTTTGNRVNLIDFTAVVRQY